MTVVMPPASNLAVGFSQRLVIITPQKIIAAIRRNASVITQQLNSPHPAAKAESVMAFSGLPIIKEPAGHQTKVIASSRPEQEQYPAPDRDE